MNKFPKCPKWGGGVTYNVSMHGDCKLHVPMGLCATQKAVADLATELSTYVSEQFAELATPDDKKQQAVALMQHLEKQYQQLEVEAAGISAAYIKAQTVVLEGVDKE
jgi:hypothetical protein